MPITPYITGYKKGLHQYCCFSLEGAGESVCYSTSAEQDGERGGSGEGGIVLHMDKSGRSCVAYCLPPSTLAHPHTVGGEVGYTTTTLPRLLLLVHTAGGTQALPY